MSSPPRTPDVPRDRYGPEPDDTGPVPIVGNLPAPPPGPVEEATTELPVWTTLTGPGRTPDASKEIVAGRDDCSRKRKRASASRRLSRVPMYSL